MDSLFSVGTDGMLELTYFLFSQFLRFARLSTPGRFTYGPMPEPHNCPEFGIVLEETGSRQDSPIASQARETFS